MSKEIRAVKFDRVSSKDQRDGYSLEAQNELGGKYAKERGLKIVRAWSVHESASKEDDRKHFFEMIEFVKTNNIKDVIFDKVDRACRGLKSAVKIDELIDDHGVRFHFTREHLIIDKESPSQEKLRFYLGIILGKYYIDNLKIEINKGLSQREKNGLWNGKAPFGYKNVRTGPRKVAMVVPDKNLTSMIEEVFELYSSGNYGYEALAEFVNSKSNVKITRRLIETMLNNPFYYGAMKRKGKIMQGAHAPIIDKKLFDACQKIKGIRAANHQKRHETVLKPFMGFMKCGNCYHAITGEARKKSNGKTYVYYHCANKQCSQYKPYIPQNKLFEIVTEAFEPFAKWTPKAAEAFVKNIHEKLQDLDLYTQKMAGELAGQRLELKKRIEELDKYRESGVLSQDEYEAVVSIPKKLLEDKTLEIKAYQDADLKTFEEGCRVIKLFYKVRDFMKLDGNELEKVRLAKMVLSNCMIKDGNFCFSYEKPFDVLLELTGVPQWWRRRESNPRPNIFSQAFYVCSLFTILNK